MDTGIQQPEGNVLQGRQRRQQKELLKDEPDASRPEGGALRLRQREDVGAVDEDAPRGRVIERAHDGQHRALAGAGRADHRDEFARGDPQPNAVQHAQRWGAWIVLDDVDEFDDGPGHCATTTTSPSASSPPMICTRVSAMRPTSTGTRTVSPLRITSTA